MSIRITNLNAVTNASAYTAAKESIKVNEMNENHVKRTISSIILMISREQMTVGGTVIQPDWKHQRVFTVAGMTVSSSNAR